MIFSDKIKNFSEDFNLIKDQLFKILGNVDELKKNDIWLLSKSNPNFDEIKKINPKLIVGDELSVLDASKNIPEFNYLILEGDVNLVLSKLLNEIFVIDIPNIVAVTGTKGKSSTVEFVRQFMEFNNSKVVSMGSIGVNSNVDLQGKVLHDAPLTTYPAFNLSRNLHHITKLGIDTVAFEASSHGLKQHRLDHVKITAAGFTNFSAEHLDYHPSMDDYFASKLRLFMNLLVSNGVAVLPKSGDKYIVRLWENIENRKDINVISYSLKDEADIFLEKFDFDSLGYDIEISIFGKKYKSRVNLIGNFQLENILCALGLSIASGAKIDDLVDSLPKLVAAEGRLMKIGTAPNGGEIYVDHAHMGYALQSVLGTIKSLVKGKIHVVFGAGGNRDPMRRIELAKAAYDMADFIYVTDDNPRFEDPQKIRSDIISSIPKSDKVQEIPDRKVAIEQAILASKPGDIVVVAGKGHEKYQIIRDQMIPFDDQEVIRDVIRNMKE